MMETLRSYDRVVLLTSRDISDAEETLLFLRSHGVQISDAWFCPRKELFAAWKAKVVDEESPDGNVDWIDDMFDKTGVTTVKRSSASGEIRRLPVSRGSLSGDTQYSEPPSL
jgi:hypothetical protein